MNWFRRVISFCPNRLEIRKGILTRHDFISFFWGGMFYIGGLREINQTNMFGFGLRTIQNMILQNIYIYCIYIYIYIYVCIYIISFEQQNKFQVEQKSELNVDLVCNCSHGGKIWVLKTRPGKRERARERCWDNAASYSMFESAPSSQLV